MMLDMTDDYITSLNATGADRVYRLGESIDSI